MNRWGGSARQYGVPVARVPAERAPSRVAAMTDEQLVVAIAGASNDALAELYRRHAPWLLARLRHRCADDGIVAEALQDTFVAVWKAATSFDGRGAAGAWLWGIAIRRLIGQLRKRHPEPMLVEERWGGAVSAEELVLLGTEHGDLAGALDGLSPELRAVVQATVLDGLTTREAGRLLGIPAGTVKTRMMRARAEMRGALT